MDAQGTVKNIKREEWLGDNHVPTEQRKREEPFQERGERKLSIATLVQRRECRKCNSTVPAADRQGVKRSVRARKRITKGKRARTGTI